MDGHLWILSIFSLIKSFTSTCLMSFFFTRHHGICFGGGIMARVFIVGKEGGRKSCRACRYIHGGGKHSHKPSETLWNFRNSLKFQDYSELERESFPQKSSKSKQGCKLTFLSKRQAWNCFSFQPLVQGVWYTQSPVHCFKWKPKMKT